VSNALSKLAYYYSDYGSYISLKKMKNKMNESSSVNVSEAKSSQGLRILHWTDMYPLHAQMHHGHAVRDLLAHLKAHSPEDRHKVEDFLPCFTPLLKGLGGKFKDRAMALEKPPWHEDLSYRTRLTLFGKMGAHWINPAWQRWAGRRLADVVDCDLIHVHTSRNLSVAAMVAASKMGIPYVLTLRYEAAFITKLPPRQANAIIDAVNHADAVITLTENLRERILSYSDADPIVIPNGTNPYFDELGIVDERSESRKLLFVGDLYKNKAVHLIVAAVKELKNKYADLSLTIVGDGEELNDLKQSAVGCEFIEFKGRLDREAIREEMRKATVLCLPSYRESFGIVCAEAMKQGLAVIFRRDTCLHGMGEDGQDYVTFERDEHFCAQLDSMLSNQDHLRSIAQSGQQLASSWTWAGNVDMHYDIYEKLIRYSRENPTGETK
jgi:glycosyltransferase involved in cell wall biosynthesis